MNELHLKTSLSPEEIEDNFKNTDVFSGIMEGLNEVLAFEKGKANAKTFVRKRSLPAVDVAGVRTSLNMTQKNFANMLGVSPRTVESWECGHSTPTPTAKKLIYLIQTDHSIATRLLSE